MPAPNLKDLTGRQFGSWTVIRDDGIRNSRGSIRWLCRCVCGAERHIAALRSGKSRSCGCQRGHGSHGMCNSPEYRTWRSMKARCLRPDHDAYEYYGGRGIEICKEWVSSFETFYVHVGAKPGPEYSLDRINSDGHYEPGNVRWATPQEQWDNRKQRCLTFNTYQYWTRIETRYPKENFDGIVYYSIGLAAESGEIANEVARAIRNDNSTLTPARKTAVIEEIGDCLWHLTALADILGVRLEDVARSNKRKLDNRKPLVVDEY